MEKMYLSADLNSLIEELSKYDDIEKVIDFIKSIDLLHLDIPKDFKYKNLTFLLNEIVILAINKTYSEEKLDRENLLKILNNIPTRIKTLEDEFTFDVQEMTNTAFEKRIKKFKR